MTNKKRIYVTLDDDEFKLYNNLHSILSSRYRMKMSTHNVIIACMLAMSDLLMQETEHLKAQKEQVKPEEN